MKHPRASRPVSGPNADSKASAAAKSGPVAVSAAIVPELKKPGIAALIYVGILVGSIPLTGFSRFSGLYALYLILALSIAAGELAFLRSVFRKGLPRLLPAWKKFTGYSIPVYYFAHALPRIEWSNAGLIGPGRVVFLFVLTLAAVSAAGIAFYFSGRPTVLAAAGVIEPEEAANRALRKRRARERKPRGLVAVVLDWVDAIAWAAIAVLVVNIFVFQLYEVPSESMVPAFLVRDRPFTVKLSAGPRIPLTEWRLPFLRLPRRGDVVTISNPRYPENHRVDLKKHVSQFVYMVTLTAVHLDSTLPDGTPKADPLVKRVTGLPGEKLMMVDDILYARRTGESDFHKVEEPWSAVDLWKLGSDIRRKIQHLPLDEQTRALLSRWDARKNGADPADLGRTLRSHLDQIESSLDSLAASGREAASGPDMSRTDPALRTRRDEAVDAAAKGRNPFVEAGASADDLSLALGTAASPAARAALRAYAGGGTAAAAAPALNSYDRGSRVVNLLIKANLLARMNRVLGLLAAGIPLETAARDAERGRLVTEARELYLYLQGFYDNRNFPEFPAGDAFLASDEYFAMGDNRYNSLDFRFRETPGTRALDPADPASIRYVSILEPFAVKLKFIEGHAVFRLWPPSRLGWIR
mgnify:CR=1 FL=1